MKTVLIAALFFMITVAAGETQAGANDNFLRSVISLKNKVEVGVNSHDLATAVSEMATNYDTANLK